MDSFENIKAIWQSEKGTALPDVTAITRMVKHHQKRQSGRMVILLIAILVLLSVFIVLILFYDYKLWTTLAGEILFVISGLYMLWMKYRTYSAKRNHELLDNEHYLEKLRQEKIHDFSKISRRQLTAFFLWLLAACLYFFEFFSQSATTLFAGYGCLLIFSLIMWFGYRPYMKRRYWKRNQHFIDQIEILKQQIQ